MSASISQGNGFFATNSTINIDSVNFTAAPPSDSVVKELIHALSFAEMENRRFAVDDEHHGTCEWLLETEEWLRWQATFDEPNIPALLWIRGRAGAGKSTIMKFAAERGHMPAPKEIVLTHFFNARGTDLEKSTEGMYRTILVQLLAALPEECRELDKGILRLIPPGGGAWQLGRLTKLLKSIIQACKDRRITCFVDALDECDETQIRAMIPVFISLIEKNGQNTSHFRVCFASRYYPNVSVPVGKCIDLAIESQAGHETDIIEYVRGTLVIRDSNLARIALEGIQWKARGVFMWCALTIRMLNRRYDKGQLNSEDDVRSALEQLPDELTGLYEEVLGLSKDSSETPDPMTLTCLQAVMFSRRGLSPRELWRAAHLGEILHGRLARNLSHEAPSNEHAILFVRNVSRGLLEVREAYNALNRVHLAHETVRVFMLKESGLARLMGVTVGKHDPMVGVESQVHERLKAICLVEMSILAEEHGNGLYGEDGAMHQQKYRLPLLKYAVCWTLYHAEHAARAGICQHESLTFIRRQWHCWTSFSEDQVLSSSLILQLVSADFPNLMREHYKQLAREPGEISKAMMQFAKWQWPCRRVDRESLRVWVEQHLRSLDPGFRRDALHKLASTITWECPRPPKCSIAWKPWRVAYASGQLILFFLLALTPDDYLDEVWDVAQDGNLGRLLAHMLRRGIVTDFLPDKTAKMWLRDQAGSKE